MTSKIMPSVLTTPFATQPSFGEYAKYELNAVIHPKALKDAGQVRPHRRHADLEVKSNLFVAHAAKDAFDNPRFLRR